MANSPEYQTLIQLTPELTTAFRNDLIKLSDEFLAEGLISDDNAANLKNPHNDANRQASLLVGWIRNRIELDPKNNYPIFIDVLKRRVANHKSILRRLDGKYEELSVGANDEADTSDALVRKRKPTKNPKEKKPQRVETDISDEKPSNSSNIGERGPSKFTVVIWVLLIVGGVCAVGWCVYTISTSHNRGVQRFQSDNEPEPTKASRKKADIDSSMDPQTKDDEIENFNDLIQAVKEIGDWYSLCTNIGVGQEVMDPLVHSNDVINTKKSKCLRAYFNTGEAKWSEVVKAVAMHPINNKRVANKIAAAHSVN